MSKFQRLLPLAAVLALAGCGGGTHHAPKPPPRATTPLGAQPAPMVQQAAQCPSGAATMGCAIARSPALRALPPLKITGGKLPDVSSYQGCPNWNAVKAAGGVGGIAKAGEYVTDPSLGCNARGLRAAHLFHAYYWFVRGYDCTTQAGRFVAAVRAVDQAARVLVLDAEVPAARGQIPCMVAYLHAHGYIVVVYTAPGTWPGGGNAGAPLWVATYGSHPSFANLWTSSPLAWQFTGDCFGPAPHSFPGISGSCIDVSVDYGITRLGASPTPVRCFGAHAQIRDRRCQAPRAAVGARNAEIRRLRAQMLRRGCRKTILTGPVSFPVPKVVPGRNARRAFCVRLFRIGAADHRYIDRAIARTY